MPQSEEKEMLEYHWLVRLLLQDLPVIYRSCSSLSFSLISPSVGAEPMGVPAPALWCPAKVEAFCAGFQASRFLCILASAWTVEIRADVFSRFGLLEELSWELSFHASFTFFAALEVPSSFSFAFEVRFACAFGVPFPFAFGHPVDVGSVWVPGVHTPSTIERLAWELIPAVPRTRV